jgi:hypothetical protein
MLAQEQRRITPSANPPYGAASWMVTKFQNNSEGARQQMDQSQRFGKWRQRLPKNTAKLADIVDEQIVALFESRGIIRHADYAGGRARSVRANCIPL